MPSSPLILAILDAFRSEFSGPTWAKVVPLILGTILARGRRTVAALRQAALDHKRDFSKYHQTSSGHYGRPCGSPYGVCTC